MKMIVGPRSCGKTKELILMSSEDWLYIVCANSHRSDHITGLAKDMGVKIPAPILFKSFARSYFHPPGIRGFLIDNVDEFVRYMARGVEVVAMTATTRQNNEENQLKKDPYDDSFDQRLVSDTFNVTHIDLE